ncbi:MAG TPA: LysR substrate-binding domain-containing protein, partial [Burkholderiaceae bacterium]
LALLPRHAVSSELASGRLRELPVSELPLQHSWCVVHPRDRRLSPVAQSFLEFIRSNRARINALNLSL